MPTKPVKDNERQRCLRACGNCARRKERCSGQVPCTGCLQRRVAGSCRVATAHTIPTARSRSGSLIQSRSRREGSSQSSNSVTGTVAAENEAPRPDEVRAEASPPHDPEGLPFPAPSAPSPTHHTRSLGTRTAANESRTRWGAAGEMIYQGDTADSTLLEDVRRLAQDVVGDCDFVNNRLQHNIAEPIPQGPGQWTRYLIQKGPPKPSLDEAKNLIKTFIWVSTSFFDLFDETDLLQSLEPWVSAPSEQNPDQDTIYFLVLAIAAQADPADKESLADDYFAYGRYLVACHYSEQPSTTAVQAYVLIAMYLLSAARRDAAFMYTGVATRAAYALGLHRGDIAHSFPAEQQIIRQRLWKVVIVLDGYVSTILGRKPASTQPCGAIINNHYSSCLALCQIFQEILHEIYSEKHVSSDALRKISDHQREWTTRLREGLENDGIQLTDYIGTAHNREVNLGLLAVKSGYYWSIILLIRPFLVNLASSIASAGDTSSAAPCFSSATANVMISACVTSAINLIELFQKLGSLQKLPRRLPFAVNSVHTASLILALSVFLGIDRLLRIDHYLEAARSILIRFRAHDPIASRNFAINESLQRCCDSFVKKREQKSFKRQGQLVAEHFGSLKEPEPQPLNIGSTFIHSPKDGSYSMNDLFGSDYNLEASDGTTYSFLDMQQPPIPLSEDGSWNFSDLFSSDHNFRTSDNTIYESMDVAQPPIGDQEPEFAASTTAPDQYDFNLPPDDTFFGSCDSSIPHFSTLGASFVDVV